MSKIAIGEAFEKVITSMEGYVDEVQQNVNSIFEDFEKIIKENVWKVLYDTGVGLENTYNSEVLGNIKAEIKKWSEEEGSYVKVTERFKMGEEAKSKAQSQQDSIVDKINNIQEIGVIKQSMPNFEDTAFETEKVKQGLEELASKTGELNTLVEDKDAELEALSEENESVKTIVNVGITYGRTIANFTSKVMEKINNILSDNISNMSSDNESAIATGKQNAEAFNQSIDEQVSSMESILTDIFG
jgi:hypothetical protein